MPVCFEKRTWAFMISVNKLMKIQLLTPVGTCQIVWKVIYGGGDLA